MTTLHWEEGGWYWQRPTEDGYQYSAYYSSGSVARQAMEAGSVLWEDEELPVCAVCDEAGCAGHQPARYDTDGLRYGAGLYGP